MALVWAIPVAGVLAILRVGIRRRRAGDMKGMERPLIDGLIVRIAAPDIAPVVEAGDDDMTPTARGTEAPDV